MTVDCKGENEMVGSLLVTTVLICGTMVGFGLLFQKRPPKQINSLYGYRTTMSMKNQSTWEFAHRYAGTIWFYSGIAGFAIAAGCLLFCQMEFFDGLSVACQVIQLVLLVAVIAPTERALRKRFDSQGNPKE